jgi:hypothetical protein
LGSAALLFFDNQTVIFVVSFIPLPLLLVDLADFIITIGINNSQNAFFLAIFKLSLCKNIIVIKPSKAVSFTINNLSGIDKISVADCHYLIFNPVGVSLDLLKTEFFLRIILVVNVHKKFIGQWFQIKPFLKKGVLGWITLFNGCGLSCKNEVNSTSHLFQCFTP